MRPGDFERELQRRIVAGTHADISGHVYRLTVLGSLKEYVHEYLPKYPEYSTTEEIKGAVEVHLDRQWQVQEPLMLRNYTIYVEITIDLIDIVNGLVDTATVDSSVFYCILNDPIDINKIILTRRLIISLIRKVRRSYSRLHVKVMLVRVITQQLVPPSQ